MSTQFKFFVLLATLANVSGNGYRLVSPLGQSPSNSYSPSGSSPQVGQSKQPSLQFDQSHLNKIGEEFEAAISNMKGKINGNNKNPGEIHTCCENGVCRVIDGSSRCEGALSITSGGSKIPPSLATSGDKLKSPTRDLSLNKSDPSKLEDNTYSTVFNWKATNDNSPSIYDKSRTSVTSGNRPASLAQISTIYGGENVRNPPRDSPTINLQPSLGSFKVDTNDEESQKYNALKALMDAGANEQEPQALSSLNKSGSFGQLDNNMARNSNDALQTAEEPPRDELKSSRSPYLNSNGMKPKQRKLRERTQKLIPGTNGKYAVIPAEEEVQDHSSIQPWNIGVDKVESIRQQLLKKANMYRNYYGFDSLALNENLNNFAQEWANKLAQENIMQLRPDNMYGENIFAGIGMKRIGAIAADQWFNEVRDILPSDNEVQLAMKYSKIRQCVQLLWESTTEMGVGVSKSTEDNYYYIVADFNPKGNVQYIYWDSLPRFTEKDIREGQEAYNWYQKQKKETKTWETDHEPTSAELEKSAENLTIGIPSLVNYRNEDGEDTKGNSPPERNTVRPTESPADSPTRKVIGVNPRDPRYELVAELPDKIPFTVYPVVPPLNLSDNDVSLIRADVFKKSNMYRKKYNMPPLTIDEQLNNYAQEWANTMAETMEFKHRPSDNKNYKGYGENLHKSNECLHIGELGVDLWFYEVGFIHVGDSDAALHANNQAGHLLQLLWKVSKDVGIAAAKDKKGKIYIVANYNPPGCAEHFYLENIPKFTEDDIAEGKRKQAKINSVQRSMRIQGKIGILPGWTSEMYDDQ